MALQMAVRRFRRCLGLASFGLALLLSGCGARASDNAPQPVLRANLPAGAEQGLPAVGALRAARDIDPAYVDIAHLSSFGGEAELLAPDRIALGTAATGGDGAFSYAIYDQELDNFTAKDVHCQIEPADNLNGQPGSYWLAVANFEQSSWEWHGPFSTAQNTIDLTSSQGYASGWGHAFFAVVPATGFGCTVNSIIMASSPDQDQSPSLSDNVITVGPGQDFDNLMDALDAEIGTELTDIVVYPQADNAPYVMTALFIDRPNLRFWGIRTADNQRPVLDGSGFEFSGVGSTPRAVFQFQPGADNCEVNGFEITGAHNGSYNGAGVRVNQAKACRVRDCVIHGCDMGLMSNGDSAAQTGQLWLENSQIHSNGSLEDPGYNHNIYAGGYELRMSGCEVYGSLTGHNVKSRAHINVLNGCYVHDSANREFDLVDEAGNTDIPGSYTLVVGCIIEKAEAMDGNKAVIHYGQDGGNDHTGPLYLVNNTIVTPYISPVVQLSAAGASLTMYNNIVWDGGVDVAGQTLVAVSGGADIANAGGSHNWLSGGFSIPAGSSFDSGTMYFAAANEEPPFVEAANGDYRLQPGSYPQFTKAGLGLGDSFPTPTDGNGNVVAIFPAHVYRAPISHFVRVLNSDDFDIGAYQSP